MPFLMAVSRRKKAKLLTSSHAPVDRNRPWYVVHWWSPRDSAKLGNSSRRTCTLPGLSGIPKLEQLTDSTRKTSAQAHLGYV